MIHRFWFKPKTIGYGATPSTWEGWAVTSAYIAVIATALVVMLATTSDQHSFTAWFVFCIFALCVTAIFVLFCKAKMRGDWHWRNGHEPN
jgi:uncharacterized membrane protein YbhN (UPF0104 family)